MNQTGLVKLRYCVEMCGLNVRSVSACVRKKDEVESKDGRGGKNVNDGYTGTKETSSDMRTQSSGPLTPEKKRTIRDAYGTVCSASGLFIIMKFGEDLWLAQGPSGRTKLQSAS